MARTFVRQDTQVRQSDLYDDTLTVGVTLETGQASIEGDLNALRSQAKRALVADGGGDWFQDINTPGTFEGGAKRGITNLNTDLHELERKRVLVSVTNVNDITVPAAVQATATFTSSGVFSDGETVTIGAQTYTFKSPFVDAANNIDASGTTAQTHENLRRAINGDGVAGTNYGTGTAVNVDVTAADTATTNVLTAILSGTVGNLITVSDTAVNATFGGATLTGGAGDVAVLTGGQLPSNTIAAVGAVTTRGTVAAFNASFPNFTLDEVAGTTPIAPKNMCEVVDGNTRDPVLSGGRKVYCLFQTETATDGHTMTGAATTRALLAFVRLNSTADDMERVPAADMGGLVINYCNIERKALDDLNEQDFLKGAILDVPATTTITRQVSYDNQGTTPVDLTTNATLDLQSAGIVWQIRDNAEQPLFRIEEGSGTADTEIQFAPDVDVFNNDAAVNDFDQGVKLNTSGTQIDVGVTPGVLETTGTDDLRILGAGELYLDDGNQAASTWAQASGIKLSDTTGEWDTFETNFGEVSILNAINQAFSAAANARDTKVYANVTSTTTANNDVGGIGGGTNLDAQLPDFSTGVFLQDYDVFLNGNLLRPGANAAADNDYYPGTSTADGQLKFEFVVKLNDVICVIPYV